MKREIKLIPNVYCPKVSLLDLQPLNRCDTCPFCNSVSETEVDCSFDTAIMLKRMHVTEFETKDHKYKIVNTRDMSKEEYDALKSKTDLCENCCFHRTVKNSEGEECYCALRYSASGTDEIVMLCCYEDEFWVECIEDNKE